MLNNVKKNDFRKSIYEINQYITRLFQSIDARIDTWAKTHRQLREEFNSLRDEIATNGVVRDLRRAEKRIKVLETAVEAHHQFMHSELDRLDHNGVATAINELNKEVFHQEKGTGNGLMYAMLGVSPVNEPTLAGKVDAIIEHLGLDLSVKPEQTTPSQVVATKKKPAAKKRR